MPASYDAGIITIPQQATTKPEEYIYQSLTGVRRASRKRATGEGTLDL